MNVAVIGSGGREHALCEAISKSAYCHNLYAIPGNPGMAHIANCIDRNPLDNRQLISFCLEHSIDLVIPGSEVFLQNNITDDLSQAGIKVFGPSRKATQIESSKTFAKRLMKQYGIPTAQYQEFDDYDNALSYVREHELPIVIKYDGLAGGKGVVVATTFEEAKTSLDNMLQKRIYGTDSVIIEEFLEGPEFSFMCFVHHKQIIPMPIAQDHKRLLDGNKGPNTGGMGVYSPVPIIPNNVIDEAMTKVMQPIVNALYKEGYPYTGFLYGGLMNTKDGVKVIEFNARFGDPEAEVILPKLESDILEVINSLFNGIIPSVNWNTDFVVGVVMASNGYPQAYKKGFLVHGIEQTNNTVYHMGTAIKDNKLVTNGGRVLLVRGSGSTLQKAVDEAYQNVENIKCDNLIYRKDIGHGSL